MVDGQAKMSIVYVISAAFIQLTNDMVPLGRLQRSFHLSIPVICLLIMVLLVSVEAFAPLMRNDTSPLQRKMEKPSLEGKY
jgi:predicted MFS family arabinose efflux permease